MNEENFSIPLYAACLLMAFAPPGWSQVTGEPQVGVELALNDDAGKPVAEANTVISYIGVAPNTGKTFRLTSGATGTVRAKSSLKGHIKAKVSKEGYYPVVWPQVLTKGAWNGNDLFRAEITLRQIRKPIALNAKKVELSVPAFEQWLGYDLKKGDWISPWGKGVIGDLEIYAEKTFDGYKENIKEKLAHLSELHETNPRLRKSYINNAAEFYSVNPNQFTFEKAKQHEMGHWSGKLKLRVPTEGGGVHLEKNDYQEFSSGGEYYELGHWEMRLPHLAPENGYHEKPLAWNKSYPSPSPPDIDPGVGYFLRTRVKLDHEGQIISANYAKIMTSNAKYHGSDIHFDPRGKISFTYYFNPTANDRNLEFDPQKNLFLDLEDNEKVFLP